MRLITKLVATGAVAGVMVVGLPPGVQAAPPEKPPAYSAVATIVPSDNPAFDCYASVTGTWKVAKKGKVGALMYHWYVNGSPPVYPTTYVLMNATKSGYDLEAYGLDVGQSFYTTVDFYDANGIEGTLLGNATSNTVTCTGP